MPNQQIFCNVPWNNTHIYWDGSFGMCCSERHAPHTEPQRYNLQNMTIPEWHQQEPMVNSRRAIMGNVALSECQGCYQEEAHGYESKRIKENFKSVIFTEQAFDRSYAQSPTRSVFEDAALTRSPVDWHVDLGNECNLACKMCTPRYSSKISNHYVKWQLIDQSKNNNWTTNPAAWQNFLDSVIATPDLNRIHFMGGETLLNKRLPEFLDFLISNNRTALSISLVTNGTVQRSDIIDQLKQFRRCDVEVSLESIHSNNDYIRQGSSTAQVLDHIKILAAQQTDTFKVVLRSVPQLLNINNYDQYLLWAWRNMLPVQGGPLLSPRYLQIQVLPMALRQQLVAQYQQVKHTIGEPAVVALATGRSTATLAQTLRRECDAMINMLNAPEPDDVAELRQQLAVWLQRWDREYRLDAHNYYPEYREFLDAIQYTI